ncbi:hypothetical protein [Niveispirillum sp. KHB5.9]|uniref:hypothetical protein n=1 Tax=Niveispirillum sp. KHB5.9 TaxID=3400269 RepID=UPI003A88CAD7
MAKNALEMQQEIFDIVNHYNSSAKDLFIGQIRDGFLGGKLYTVGFNAKKQNSDEYDAYINYVFDKDGDFRVYRNDTQLLDMVASIKDKSRWHDKIFSTNGISGVIAIIMTVAIVYMALSNSTETKIPDILGNALTIILGFYFGKATKDS